MDYSTPIPQSLTVWAGTITTVSGMLVLIAKLFGIELLQDETEQLIGAIVIIVTGVTAIYGRIRAKSKLKGFDIQGLTVDKILKS